MAESPNKHSTLNSQLSTFRPTLGIVGVGLIGGSLGLAAKKRGLARKVLGIGRSAEKLERAKNIGAVDEFTTNLAVGAGEADCLVICVPVLTIIPILSQMAPHLKQGCIVTDVGSTKAQIVEQAEKLLRGRNPFVGGHPMAGSEEAGVDAADADLFVGATYVLTRSSNTDEIAFAQLSAFASALGADVVTMSPEEHDRRAAIISHLPHVLAAALMEIAKKDENDANSLFRMAAGSFRDATRVASSPPNLWRDICESNAGSIAQTIDEMQDALTQVKLAIVTGDFDAVEEMFIRAKATRDALARKKRWGDQ